MAKLQEVYKAIMQKQSISFIMKDDERATTDMQGHEGNLEIYVSEHKYPGKKFVVFIPLNGDTALHTSPGSITIENDLLTIRTHGGENCFIFRLLEKVNTRISNISLKMPQKFLHICEVCDRTEVLSPDEAFNAGWDYPPRIGKFGVLSPKTCGSCSMIDTVYWKLVTGEINANNLTDKQMKTIERIKGEPFSLIPSGEGNKDC